MKMFCVLIKDDLVPEVEEDTTPTLYPKDKISMHIIPD